MAKYSTGSGGDSAGGSCELCGKEGGDLRTADVAGATLDLCGTCASTHGDAGGSGGGGGGGGGGDSEERNRRKKAAQNVARIQDAQKADASHWEDGADYDDDQLPYLVRGYGDIVTEARQDEGLQTGDLAADLDADESDVVAVEQGRATQANIGGSLIRALEDRLDVTLVEE